MPLLFYIIIFIFCLPQSIVAEPFIVDNATMQSSDSGKNDNMNFKIMTLNMGHGRGKNFHQLLISEAQIKNNLRSIIKISSVEQLDILTLQEADAPSYWSGYFNHIDFIAVNAGFDNWFQGKHVEGRLLQYGTAILSKEELYNNASGIFTTSSPFTFSKGFVISTIQFPGKKNMEVDIISVHLDFMLESTRQRQAEELVNYVRNRNRPVILAGDLNDHWEKDNGVVYYLMNALELKAYQPEENGLISYPRLKKRYDWILISKEFEFKSYEVLSDELSDHQAVVAEIKLVNE
jgi:endonuclease/exonuclease/phosphatase family metal-dependent hydrolase